LLLLTLVACNSQPPQPSHNIETQEGFFTEGDDTKENEYETTETNTELEGNTLSSLSPTSEQAHQQQWREEFSQRHSTFESYVSIGIARDDLLRGFEYIYTIDEHSKHSYTNNGADIAFWVIGESLIGFEFLAIEDKICDCCLDFYFVPGDVLFSLDTLPQNHAVVFLNHISRGAWPNWAISFLDAEGQRRYVGFVDDLSAEIAPLLFVEIARDDGFPPWSLPPWRFDD